MKFYKKLQTLKKKLTTAPCLKGVMLNKSRFGVKSCNQLSTCSSQSNKTKLHPFPAWTFNEWFSTGSALPQNQTTQTLIDSRGFHAHLSLQTVKTLIREPSNPSQHRFVDANCRICVDRTKVHSEA